MITDKRMSAARVAELRACHNPVFDELLDFVQEMSNEYQKWICELEGPTPAELLEKIKTLELDLHAAIVREREAERRADAADTIVLPVEDGEPGEIDVLSDGHSHHYVPKSSYMELHVGFDIQSERLDKIAKYVGATDYVDSIGHILDAIDKLKAGTLEHTPGEVVKLQDTGIMTSRSAQISASVAREVAVAASVDPRTLAKFLAGRDVSPMCAVRIERALRARHLHHLIRPAGDAGEGT